MLEHAFYLGDEALETGVVERNLPIVVDLENEVDDFGSRCSEVVSVVGHTNKAAEARTIDGAFERIGKGR